MVRVARVLIVLVLSAILSTTFLSATALAQGVYLGAGVSSPTLREFDRDTAGLSPQFGINITPSLGVRTTLETNVNLNQFRYASADALLNVLLPLVTLYFGGGADAFFTENRFAFDSTTQYGAHATGGAEVRVGPLGVFGEAQPGFTFGLGNAYFRACAGVNLHF